MSVTKLPKPDTSSGRAVEAAVRRISPRSAVGKLGVAVGAEIGGALADGAHKFVQGVARGMTDAGEGRPGQSGAGTDQGTHMGEGSRNERWAAYVEQARREQQEARRRMEEAFRQARAAWHEGAREASGAPRGDRGAGSDTGGNAGHDVGGGAGRRPAPGADPRPCRYRGRPVPDYYEVLEVSPRARQTVIEKAYRALMRECHPDTGGDPRRAQLINEAYEVLCDPHERQRFDQENGLN